MYNDELVSPAILPSVIQHQESSHDASESRCHHDSNLGGDVFGRIRGSEGQRANDVAETYPDMCQLLNLFDGYVATRATQNLQKDMSKMAFMVTFFVCPA